MALTIWTVAAQASAQGLSLAGQWRFQMDRADVGIQEQWFNRTLPDTVKLPGTLAGQGIGDDVNLNTPWTGWLQDKEWFKKERYAPYARADNFKFPFWLQPEKYYVGAAWFQRDIEIPTNWVARRVVLFLERVHWETRVWVDNRLVGTNNSLSTPHEYDLGQLTPGKHTLTVRVDNRRIVDIGQNSHAISDHTQGNWNGIVGKIELRTTPLVWIEEVQIYPNLVGKCLKVKGRLRNASGQAGEGTVHLSVGDFVFSATQVPVNWTSEGGTFEKDISVNSLPAWDEFTLVTQPLDVSLSVGRLRLDSRTIGVGLREVSTSGTQITINGRKTFLRGTLECAIFPKTGHPPMDVDEWRRIISVAKAHGLNLLRFHSWCPPEAAFKAADQLGMYFQIETCWPDHPAIGEGKPVDQWIYDETDRILKYYGNHPSFLMMAHGNEPGGKQASAFLAKYVAHYKAKDPRRLWTSGSGWPELPENQFHVTPKPRIQQWGGGLKSRINALPPETASDYRDFISQRTVPVISHEIGQWCVYPNFDEIPKYTGYLKPKNFEIFRDLAEKNGLFGRAGSPLPAATNVNNGTHGVTRPTAKDFLLASGKLQTLCYKEDIESALRTPGMGGFHLLDLHDFPGQGTALVGVLDPFWEEKGYVTAADYRRFCNSTVPLVRLKKRVFTTEETLEAEVNVAHFGPAPLEQVQVISFLKQNGRLHGDRQIVVLRTNQIPIGNNLSVGRIRFDFSTLSSPLQLQLQVSLQVPGAHITGWDGLAWNDWDIWVYPAKSKTEPTKDILITAQFDDAAQKHLASGGKLLLTIPGTQVRNYDVEPVKLGFSSIFWNTAWTKRQAPTTLGILCDPKHPALADFPTDFHSNWQWWYLIHRGGALRLDLLPRDIEPVVRVIDDWVTARPLGLVVEAKVGQGSAIVCGFDLTRDSDDPVSRQMRASLLKYMAGPEFKPAVAITSDQLRSLIAEPLMQTDLKTKPESK